ncbi:MAG: hypothetical protein NTZ65_03105 [Candidatus Berkelbacteria bacterium]|nr:hypothetical protein [Candidatus Berkelbacteria bacterium]
MPNHNLIVIPTFNEKENIERLSKLRLAYQLSTAICHPELVEGSLANARLNLKPFDYAHGLRQVQRFFG